MNLVQQDPQKISPQQIQQRKLSNSFNSGLKMERKWFEGDNSQGQKKSQSMVLPTLQNNPKETSRTNQLEIRKKEEGGSKEEKGKEEKGKEELLEEKEEEILWEEDFVELGEKKKIQGKTNFSATFKEEQFKKKKLSSSNKNQPNKFNVQSSVRKVEGVVLEEFKVNEGEFKMNEGESKVNEGEFKVNEGEEWVLLEEKKFLEEILKEEKKKEKKNGKLYEMLKGTSVCSEPNCKKSVPLKDKNGQSNEKQICCACKKTFCVIHSHLLQTRKIENIVSTEKMWSENSEKVGDEEEMISVVRVNREFVCIDCVIQNTQSLGITRNKFELFSFCRQKYLEKNSNLVDSNERKLKILQTLKIVLKGGEDQTKKESEPNTQNNLQNSQNSSLGFGFSNLKKSLSGLNIFSNLVLTKKETYQICCNCETPFSKLEWKLKCQLCSSFSCSKCGQAQLTFDAFSVFPRHFVSEKKQNLTPFSFESCKPCEMVVNECKRKSSLLVASKKQEGRPPLLLYNQISPLHSKLLKMLSLLPPSPPSSRSKYEEENGCGFQEELEKCFGEYELRVKTISNLLKKPNTNLTVGERKLLNSMKSRMILFISNHLPPLRLFLQQNQK